MAPPRSPVNLFSYTDYRRFLREWFAAVKTRSPQFSHRAFARRAGFRSSNFLLLVMEGKRNFTAASLAKCVRGLGLNKQERVYFRALVRMNQSQVHEERDRYYRQLLRSKKMSQLKPIDRKQYEYYAAWYHPVVRELVTAAGFDGTPGWVARRLRPTISVAQAERSLMLLAQLGLIAQQPNGRWRQTDSLLTTGAEVASIAVLTYHKGLLELTQGILDHVPGPQRDVSALTLGMARDYLPALKAKIQAFRREVLQMVADQAAAEVVVQLNIQCFPVTSLDVEASS